MEALIDGAAQLNLLSATVAKEKDIPVEPLNGLLAEAANGTEMTIYGTASASVVVTDSRGRHRTQMIPFVVADVKKFPMYLGLPWIDAENPKLNYLNRRMLHRGRKAKDGTPFRKVALENAGQFARTINDGTSDIYFCAISYLDEDQNTPDRQELGEDQGGPDRQGTHVNSDSRSRVGLDPESRDGLGRREPCEDRGGPDRRESQFKRGMDPDSQGDLDPRSYEGQVPLSQVGLGPDGWQSSLGSRGRRLHSRRSRGYGREGSSPRSSAGTGRVGLDRLENQGGSQESRDGLDRQLESSGSDLCGPDCSRVGSNHQFVSGRGRECTDRSSSDGSRVGSARHPDSGQRDRQRESGQSSSELQVRKEYREQAYLFSEDEACHLPDHGPHDLAINLQPGKQPPHQPLYNLSESELQSLRKYLAEYLQRGWIRRSRSPAGAPILFAKKKDGTLRLCVDYRGLNKITIKDRHPLPLIAESLERLARAKIYTKLDIREAYHRIRIRQGDEWKTAFRTRYGHFEYTVMPFGLTNAPAQFQSYINQILAGLVDITCIVYLDDILIFSDTEEEHVKHVREVLQRLKEAKLFVKLSKCEFHTRETEYLGYLVTPEGVKVDPARVETIQDWPEPKTVRDIRIFIGFMNYYRRFIEGFSKLALPLTKLTRKAPNAAKGGRMQRKEESQALDIGQEGRESFRALKDAFLQVPILAHFERDRKTKVEVDASGGAISGILSQLDPNRHVWRPIDFFSRKLNQTEYNYDTHDQELLATVASLEHWRHYLEGLQFDLWTDHNNLRWFMETKSLNNRQVRSYLKLTKYDFTMFHRPGKLNPADGPSRRPDYIAEAQAKPRKSNESFIDPLRNMLMHAFAVLTRGQEARAALEGEKSIESSNEESESESVETESESESGGESQSSESEGSVSEHPKILQSVQEKSAALRECHDNPLTGGHFGSRRTFEKLSRRYKWKGMRKDVEDYCRGCLHCRRAVAPRHPPYGLLNPLPPPKGPWEQVTMDFITDLPPSKYLNQVYDNILVIVDRLTKMAHYVPALSTWKATDLAQVWIRDIIRLHGTPKTIISDRGPLTNSKFWDTFCHYISSQRLLSSAYHPQTDGQTERQNQTLEQYLRCYCCLEQDDWARWLPIAEFAYNDSVHATTGTTPFRVYHGADPRAPDWPNAPKKSDAPLGKGVAAKTIALQAECRRKILAANTYQKAYADKKRSQISLKKGDKVLVSSRHIRTARPKKKLDWKYLGPGTIVEQINPVTFKVDLPGLRQVHPVFHVSLLEPYEKKGRLPHLEEPIVDTLREFGDDVYEVDEILDRRQGNTGVWEYLIKWKDYPPEENSWEPGVNISKEAIREFWKRKNVLTKRKRGR